MKFKTQLFTWANGLTFARILCVPVLAFLLFRNDPLSRDLAAVLFVAAALTDIADGALARRSGTVTPFGTLMDPIADKALVGVALVGLSLLGELSWWVTGIIIVRETVVTVVRLVVIRHGVMPASKGGKLKTVLQTIAIAMLLAVGPIWWSILANSVMIAALVVTVVTGSDYVVKARKWRLNDTR